jgi:hypothetical protein
MVERSATQPNNPCHAGAALAIILAIAAPAPYGTAARPAAPRSVADSAVAVDGGRSAAKVDPATEKLVRTLVRNQLPELEGVLQRLRSDNPAQYARAVGDLARSARKLEAARKRDERLYEVELEWLQAEHAVTLLTAKLKVRDDQQDRTALRQAVERLQQAQLARAEYDVQSLQTRLDRTRQLLEKAESRLQAKRDNLKRDADSSYAALLKKAGRGSPAPAKRAKPDPPPKANRTATGEPDR